MQDKIKQSFTTADYPLTRESIYAAVAYPYSCKKCGTTRLGLTLKPTETGRIWTLTSTDGKEHKCGNSKSKDLRESSAEI